MAMARVMLIPKDMRMFVTGYTYLGNVLNKVIVKKVFLLCFKIIFVTLTLHRRCDSQRLATGTPVPS